MSRVAEVISVQNELGVGPLWHSRDNALYWVDIGRAEVFRFRPDTGVRDRFPLDTVVSALGIWAHRKFIAATETGLRYGIPTIPS